MALYTINRPYIYVCVCVYVWREKLKNKVFQTEEFNVKESQRYYVSVLMNSHQD